MKRLDLNGLSSLQSLLSSLSDVSLSLYSDKGHMLLPPDHENPLISMIRASSRGSKEYDDFLKTNTEKMAQRTDISLVKGPAGQCHFFAPVRVEDATLTAIGAGLYLSREDFEHFAHTDSPSYGLLPDQVKTYAHEIRVKDYADIQKTARHIRSLIALFLRSSVKGNTNEKKCRMLKTIIAMLPEITPDKDTHAVFDMLGDIILFLFNAEHMSVMVKENAAFIPLKTAGRLKDRLQSLSFTTTGVVARAAESLRPSYSEEVMDMLKLGLPDEVTSIYVFPILREGKVAGILNIFNSSFDSEDADIISDICRLMGNMLGFIEMKDVCKRYLKEIDVLNTAAARLITVKEPDMLYEAILDTSVHLTEAEKGSLMLVDDTAALTIRAAKGINQRLVKEIKIQSGEGIAGWVFREGTPLYMDDIEKNDNGFSRRAKYRTGSFISIPLKMGEETIGVLNISDKISGEVFSEDDLVLLRSFASYASIALERSTYYSLAGQLKELSITDALTGLFNRRYFEERFFEELHRSDRHSLSFSLAMIDIDDFKLFNDTEGHLAGDEVLKSIANIAKECLRVSDVIARFGGEEFAVIMPQTEKEEAFLVAERIRTSVREQFPYGRSTFPRGSITVSIGVSTFPFDGRERKELIRNADKALYKAKMEGKDRTIPWQA